MFKFYSRPFLKRNSNVFLHQPIPYQLSTELYSTTVNNEKDVLMNEFLFQVYILLNNKDIYKDTPSNVAQYQDGVLHLLRENKCLILDNSDSKPEELVALQEKIESLTTSFDDAKTFHHLAPDLTRLLVNENTVTAKEYLKNSNKLSPEDFQIINNLRQYTLEVIIVYTLASLFNSVHTEKPAARVSTPVEQLDTVTREQGRIRNSRINPDTSTLPQATKHIKVSKDVNQNLVEDTSLNEITGSIKVKEKRNQKSSRVSGETSEAKSSDNCKNLFNIGTL